MALDEYRLGVQMFATFALFGPLGGPFNTADWAKHLRAKNVPTMIVYIIQLLWFLEREAAGLGMWFFLLTDWSNVNYFIAIEILWLVYAVLDWYGWPGFYFYPDAQRNYWFVAGTYALGWLCLVATWIIMVVLRAITTTGFFWTSFALMAFSSLLSAVLAGFLIYAYRLSSKAGPAGGRTPSLPDQ